MPRKKLAAGYVGRHDAVRLNRTHDVPYTGGVSEDGQTVYIDRRFPKHFKIGGKTVYTDKFLLVHELTEWNLMHHLGYSYQDAHRIATAAEAEAVHHAGVPLDDYYGVMYDLICARDTEKNLKRTPVDIDLKPYIDCNDTRLLALFKKNGHRFWK